MSKKWFSVSEKLPPAYKPVLTITNYGGVDVCYRSEQDELGDVSWHNAMRAQHSNGGVTHWQHIPNPPFFLTERAADGICPFCQQSLSNHRAFCWGKWLFKAARC